MAAYNDADRIAKAMAHRVILDEAPVVFDRAKQLELVFSAWRLVKRKEALAAAIFNLTLWEMARPYKLLNPHAETEESDAIARRFALLEVE